MSTAPIPSEHECEGLDDPLRAQLPTFETFFKTFGFKRIHGRVWGLLVLAGQPHTSKEIATELGSSLGTTSTTLNELTEWGAISSTFDSARRCHLHEPVGNTISIVATVLRRREQVIFGRFKQSAEQTLEYVRERYGDKDARVMTLRSIISSCEIAEAVMQMVFSSVASALGDPESLLSRAVSTALKVGMVPAKVLTSRKPTVGEAPITDSAIEALAGLDLSQLEEEDEEGVAEGHVLEAAPHPREEANG